MENGRGGSKLDIGAIYKAVEIIQKGGVVVYPTDTCYGIGCDATNPDAVEKIFEIKGREKDKPLPLIASSIEMIEKYVFLDERAIILYNAFPGISVSLRKKGNLVPDSVNKEKLAFRIPSNKISRKLSELSNKPIISTSANKSGDPSPYSIGQVKSSLKDFLDKIDFFIDGGILEANPPSTIVDLVEGKIGRIGKIKEEQILELLGGKL
ncbi:MAG: Threonylcarbamoyl-AMP synthase [Candidatus Methanofastidiosum methylothiophilum]|uniref:L-threonylcarbamoyladenylate synthase n=1 Tax=Candidatus Methanofastidiosum methylothiophilum TaxID=1705564 RepID=A0A150IS26_9EURY|nr:MAG: Threonylcarbamoyl-AMP synthase [Candidatus Methanofastidiosum methylthiophilus]KYC47780.1 MAG: Threonylcarbamoyl-AMP synthase [Candidatus Methanofastidiosum methylthiophilus]KYC49408.1 MAG: Threonylcarbamoyl-AMP synthase [Candidatus Methanofastidiosum methylthiophilus]